MRDAINNNPVVQAALVGLLLVVGAFFFLSTTGGGEEESAGGGETEAIVTVAGSGETGTATGATPGEAVESAIADVSTGGGAAPAAIPAPIEAPPPPAPVRAAFDDGKTVVLLFVRQGGIDDRLVAAAVAGLARVPDVASFVVPARKIARYASITQGVSVDRVPALVVIRPKGLDEGVPVASVRYGFQSPQSVVQAVIDAGYEGRTLEYHP